jgi:phosphonate degradation associated HDIG domain protein
MTPEQTADEIITLLAASANADYYGEAVSQLAHALQAAQSARDANADEELILAALLHDIGHNISDERAIRHGEGGVINHDDLGAEWLAERGFSPRLRTLVRGHVDAKRYLVTTNANYAKRLSPASTETLKHQGGPMAPDEAEAFGAAPELKDCLRLRQWDEQAKEPGRPVTPIAAYRDMIVRHLTATARPVQQG